MRNRITSNPLETPTKDPWQPKKVELNEKPS